MDDWELRREMKKKLERVKDLRIYEGGRCKLERGEWKAKKLSENKDVRFLGCCGVKSSLELNILNIIFHLNFYFLIFQKTHIRYIKFHLKKNGVELDVTLHLFRCKIFSYFQSSLANGSRIRVVAIGVINLCFESRVLILEDCFYVPNVRRNLISITYLGKHGYCVS